MFWFWHHWLKGAEILGPSQIERRHGESFATHQHDDERTGGAIAEPVRLLRVAGSRYVGTCSCGKRYAFDSSKADPER